MNVDPDKLRQLIENMSVPAIHRAHGDTGTRVYRDLAVTIRNIFHRVDPEVFNGIIVAFKCLNDSDRPLPIDEAKTIVDSAALAQEVEGNVVIQVLSEGRFLLWKNVSFDIDIVTQMAVVYKYQNRREHFLAGNSVTEVEKVGPYASLYAVPAFSTVRDAIEDYRTRMAKESSCAILQGVWADPNRVFFVHGPEITMRRSLLQFLKNVIRNADVRPEQNMDETHPVDIKINFNFTPRIGVIEIKWLGNSVHADGQLAVAYRDQRARDGAQQLADYLDMNRQQAPDHVTRGYLVVFDGRRRSLRAGTKSVGRDDGEYYRHREVDFNPRHDVARTDFETPIRMFMEAVCTS